MTLAATASAGFAVQGWAGILLWPFGLCAVALLLGIALFAIDLVVTFVRHSMEISRAQTRVRPLPVEQLRDLCANPSHSDSGFARVELMRRGIDARPPKDQLFAMLTSGNSDTCGQAMVYVQIFYPEWQALIPPGSSNHDSPELWQSRIEALGGAG